ncbi:MAG TPA: hypothetical protein VJV79_13145 [Polyangiaceae bacterium]|nr:hypothetical protein [Polyangiaceae bacterium]
MCKSYEFGLSYSTEYEDFVSKVAEALAEEPGRDKVLFTGFMPGQMNVPGSSSLIPSLYAQECEVVIAFLSKNYAAPDHWSSLEWAAIAKMPQQRVFLVSFDAASYARLGLVNDIIERIEKRAAEEIAKLVKLRWYKVVRGAQRRVAVLAPEYDLDSLLKSAQRLKCLAQPTLDIDLSHFGDARSEAQLLHEAIDAGMALNIAQLEANDRNWGNVALVEKYLTIAECVYHWHDLEGASTKWLARYEPLLELTLRDPIASFDDKPVAAQVLNYAGICHRMRSNFETARNYYVRARALSSRDPVTQCDAEFNICDIDRLDKKTLLEAEENANKALSMALQLNDENQRARKVVRAYEIHGLVLARKGEFAHACAFQGWAVARRSQLVELRPYLLALSYQVYASGMWGNLTFAQDAYKEAERLATCLDDVQTAARLHGDMAETYTRLAANEPEPRTANHYRSEARRYLDRVIQRHQRSPDKFEPRVRAQAKLRHLVTLLGSEPVPLAPIQNSLSTWRTWVADLVKFDVRQETVAFVDDARTLLNPAAALVIGSELEQLIDALRPLTSELS